MDTTTLDTRYIDAVLISFQEEVSSAALAPFALYEMEHGTSLLCLMIFSVIICLVCLNLDESTHNRITVQT